jgi:hypothetical protein
MRRKLIKQGAGGYTIYLPKRWVEEQHPAEVDIEELDGQLVISAQAGERKSATSITLRGQTLSSIRAMITNTYRLGYDTITVYYEQPEQLAILRDVIQTRLLGFEITKVEPKQCIVESITEPAPEQFDVILRKTFFTISEIFDITERRLAGENVDYEDAEERVQRYDNFCRRIIVKQTLHRKNSEMLWTFLAIILHAQREPYHVCKLGRINSKHVAKILQEARNMWKLIERAYLEKDIALLAEVHDRHQQFYFTEGYALLQKMKGKELIAGHHLLMGFRQFYLAASPLTGALL